MQRSPLPLRLGLLLLLTTLPLLLLPSAAVPAEEDVLAVDDPRFVHTTANGVRREGVDTALRKYAFLALSQVRDGDDDDEGVRTGRAYNVSLPPFLDGIFCQAMRVRLGSLHRHGVTFNEFYVPPSLSVDAFSASNLARSPLVLLVYRRVFNFTLYSLAPEYSFASPVVGIVAYPGLNSSTSRDENNSSVVTEIDVLSPPHNASVHVKLNHQTLRDGAAKSGRLECSFFDINGTVSFANVSANDNECTSTTLMDVALVVSSSSIPSSPSPPLAPSPASHSLSHQQHHSSSPTSNVWKFVLVAVFGGVLALLLFAAIVYMAFKVGNECEVVDVRSRVAEDSCACPHREDDEDEEISLQTSLIGHTRAPSAPGVRTRPVLETGSLYI